MPILETQTAVLITKAGGPEVLVPGLVPVPRPGAGQVLIRVTAAGLNRHDVNQRRAGLHSDGLATPGLEVCGTVVAVGPNVTGIGLDSRVMALVQGGGYAQYTLAYAALVMPAPDSLNDVEAAAIPEAAFTTWWNFFGLMALQKEQFALIHGGTSGVGHLALQFLSALGYQVIATCGSEAKAAAAREFGALDAFLYSAPDLAQQVLAATEGLGISTLMDVSAGAHLDQDLEMMATDGTIAHLSGGGGAEIKVPLQKIMARRIRITGSFLRPLPLAHKARIAALIRQDLWPLLGNRVRPVIALSVDFRDAVVAHREMERNRHIGKIMLTVEHP